MLVCTPKYSEVEQRITERTQASYCARYLGCHIDGGMRMRTADEVGMTSVTSPVPPVHAGLFRQRPPVGGT
jgi:hypothetical protein